LEEGIMNGNLKFWGVILTTLFMVHSLITLCYAKEEIAKTKLGKNKDCIICDNYLWSGNIFSHPPHIKKQFRKESNQG